MRSWLRAYSIELLLIAALVAAVFFFGYLGYGLLRPELEMTEFSGERALAYAVRQVEFGPRPTGSEANQAMGDWLVEELRTNGWDVVIQPFTMLLEGGETVQARNIVAVRGDVDERADTAPPVALLATHYDTWPATETGLDEVEGAAAVGANGSASGVAVLLELARSINITRTDHTVCLAFLDAEDNRDLPGWQPPFGADYLLEGLAAGIPRCANPRFVVGVSMVGGADHVISGALGGDPELWAALWRTADSQGVSDRFVQDLQQAPPGFGDAFAVSSAPSVMMADFGYAYRHTTEDSLDKLSAASLARAGLTLKTWLESKAPFGLPAEEAEE